MARAGGGRLWPEVRVIPDPETVAEGWFTRSAYSMVKALKRPDIPQVLALLDELADAAWQADVESNAPLRASVLDDGALLIEWTLSDRRLGFSFESNPEESGWYFVFSKGSSERCEAGTMNQLDVPRLVRLMTETTSQTRDG